MIFMPAGLGACITYSQLNYSLKSQRLSRWTTGGALEGTGGRRLIPGTCELTFLRARALNDDDSKRFALQPLKPARAIVTPRLAKGPIYNTCHNSINL